jgi:GNAT superfamily N-acetyltransferase
MAAPESRPLRESDLPQLLLLYTQLSAQQLAVPQAVLAQTWRSILAHPGLKYWGVLWEGRLVSTCHAVIVPNLTHGARPYAVIENVVTDSSVRRQGLGALAMRALLEQCWQAGCYKIMLASGLQRAGAHAFYESLGFSRHEKQSFVITRR